MCSHPCLLWGSGAVTFGMCPKMFAVFCATDQVIQSRVEVLGVLCQTRGNLVSSNEGALLEPF